MTTPIIIIVISFFLDGILSNFLDYMLNDLSLFTPYFTLISLIAIYPFFIKENNKYYILAAILGFLYDLFYTNLFLTNAIFFFLISYFVSIIERKIELNLITNLLLLAFILMIYHLIFALTLFIFNVVPINITNIIYLISHSLILNLIYGEILFLLCKYLPKRRHLN